MGNVIAVDFKLRRKRTSLPTLPNQSAWVQKLAKALDDMGWEHDRIVGAVMAMVDFGCYARSDMQTRRVVDRYLQLIGYA